jgi:asparagine synthase (glutamine-hydrolysing)
MCGIVAMYSHRGRVNPAALDRATDVLDHRGPDGRGRWLSADHRVGLGHTRLSIIDLVTGDQPIASEDERLHLIVNGEFYDYEAIQRRLTEAGHRLRTRSDSEIALHLYEDRGAQCLHQLRGEFAFVLWDAANHTLFAARDRFGIKPLFYAVVDGTLILASEIKALFAAGVPARWSRAGMYQALGAGADQTITLYDGVYQLPPGYYLTASGDSIQLHQYWDFDYPVADAIRTDKADAEYIAELREALQEAVRLRLRADVPVGCYLSGGLDSCAVLGLAASALQAPIRAFTLGFEGAAYDESAIACEMAQHVNAEYYPIQIRQSDLADNFSDGV